MVSVLLVYCSFICIYEDRTAPKTLRTACYSLIFAYLESLLVIWTCNIEALVGLRSALGEDAILCLELRA